MPKKISTYFITTGFIPQRYNHYPQTATRPTHTPGNKKNNAPGTPPNTNRSPFLTHRNPHIPKFNPYICSRQQRNIRKTKQNICITPHFAYCILRTTARIPHGLRGVPRSLRGIPRGLRGTPRGLRGIPRSLRGTPRGLRGIPRGLRGTPRGLRGIPRSLRGTPRGVRKRRIASLRMKRTIQNLTRTTGGYSIIYK
jgi:pre-mRNA-processing factor 8